METRSDPAYPDGKHNNSYQMGVEFQDYVCELLARENIILQNMSSKKYQYELGENLQGFEIKYDGRFLETGRLSIEIEEKSKRDIPFWTPSGIYRSDNTWLYIQGNYQRIYIFSKKMLIGLHKSGKYETGESYGTVRKYYLPLDDADKYSAKVLD